MVTFFFASAAASAAYLTAGEIFPLEIRALAIAFFFAIGTGIGGVVGPWWFANLINEGRESLYLGFVVLSAAMIAAALTELIWGVAAERRPAGRYRATADFHQMIPWDLLRCVNSVYVMKYRPEANRMIICNAILPTLSIGQLDCRDRHPCETRPSSLGTISHACRCRARHHLDS
jgi:MFS family permease